MPFEIIIKWWISLHIRTAIWNWYEYPFAISKLKKISCTYNSACKILTAHIFCQKQFERFNSDKKYDDMQRWGMKEKGNTPVHSSLQKMEMLR